MSNTSGARELAGIVAALAVAAAVALAAGQGGALVAGLPLTVLVTALAFVIQWLAFVPAYRWQTERFYDLVGSATYLSCVWLVIALAGAGPRSILLATLITVWALRLGTFLVRRIRRAGKDGRFDAIKRSAARFLLAWTLQGLWVALTLSAALAAMTAQGPAPLGGLDALGVALWLIGFSLEVVADQQKSRFRRRHPDRFIDVGLWSWSRHPNYLGEIVLWVGVAVVAASTLRGWQWITLISPVFVTVLLTKISGIPLLEQRADSRFGGDEAYERYKARTGVLIPRPPR